MISVALALALGAAVLHTVWNVLLKSSGDPLILSQRATAMAAAIATPLAAIGWLLAGRPPLPPGAWLLAVLSGVAEVAYFIFLSSAYNRGELSAVYPVARGSAPLLAVAAGIVILGERPTAAEAAGIVLVLAGIWGLRRPSSSGAALLPALLTGVAIATYTSIDKAGTGLAPPWLYGWAVWVVTALLLEAWVRIAPLVFRRPAVPPGRSGAPSWKLATVVGIFMTVTYLMVLIALRLAPLVIVAPVRESAIVLVTLWGVWRLRERQSMLLKMGGALGIVAGIGIIAAG